MAFRTGLGVTNSVKSKIRIYTLWLMATCFALIAPSPTLSFAWSGFPCEDVNNNGVCDPGEPDISANLLGSGSFSTSESIVIAPGKGFTTKSVDGISLVAGKNITINANLTTFAKGSNIILMAQGTVTVSGTSTTLRAGERGSIYIEAGQNIHAGPTRTSMYAKLGALTLLSWTGDILFEQSRLVADDIELYASEGGVKALNSTFDARKGDARVDATTDVIMNDNWVLAEITSVHTGGNLIDFRDNFVKVSRGGSVVLSPQGSTVDIRGTQFMNVDPNNVIIDAQNILQ